MTRTLSLVDDFAPSFDVAAAVIVTDIYTAGEAESDGVTGEVIAEAIVRRGAGVVTTYCASLDDVPDALEAFHESSDVVVLLGAGDVASRRHAAAGPALMSLDELVEVGGTRVSEHAPFGARTTYRVGGTVRRPGDAVLDGRPRRARTRDDDDADLPMFVLGNGSNLLVADGEHDVLGVHLVGEFEQLTTRDEGDVVVVDAGAGHGPPRGRSPTRQVGRRRFRVGRGRARELRGRGGDERRGSRFGHERVAGLGHRVARRRDAHLDPRFLGLRLPLERPRRDDLVTSVRLHLRRR